MSFPNQGHSRLTRLYHKQVTGALHRDPGSRFRQNVRMKSSGRGAHGDSALWTPEPTRLSAIPKGHFAVISSHRSAREQEMLRHRATQIKQDAERLSHSGRVQPAPTFLDSFFCFFLPLHRSFNIRSPLRATGHLP